MKLPCIGAGSYTSALNGSEVASKQSANPLTPFRDPMAPITCSWRLIKYPPSSSCLRDPCIARVAVGATTVQVVDRDPVLGSRLFLEGRGGEERSLIGWFEMVFFSRSLSCSDSRLVYIPGPCALSLKPAGRGTNATFCVLLNSLPLLHPSLCLP